MHVYMCMCIRVICKSYKIEKDSLYKDSLYLDSLNREFMGIYIRDI